jgi:hypothetical protein
MDFKQNVNVWTGFMWLQTGPSGRPLWTWQQTCSFIKKDNFLTSWATITLPRRIMFHAVSYLVKNHGTPTNFNAFISSQVTGLSKQSLLLFTKHFCYITFFSCWMMHLLQCLIPVTYWQTTQLTWKTVKPARLVKTPVWGVTQCLTMSDSCTLRGSLVHVKLVNRPATW